MNIRAMGRMTERFVIQNSPAILTAVGVTGAVSSAYLTGRASFKAAEILEDERVARNIRRLAHEDQIELSDREKFDLVWKLYIPAVGTLVLSCGALIMATRIGNRRAAAMTAAYAVSERAFTEYRDKIVEKIGENKERAARDEIAQDRVTRNPPSSQVIMTGYGEVLCKDEFSGRYFESDMESLRRAENNVNYQILHEDYATVSNYYHNIGLDPTDISDQMGWNTDKKLDLHFSSTLASYQGKENVPCMVVSFASTPIPEPWKYQ